jgi:hypothetical protein
MKTKLFTILSAVLLALFLFGFKKPQSSCAIVLTNAKTNKSIKVCDKYNPDKIDAILGRSISMDKEQPEKDEAPVYTFHYDGLELVMQNDKVVNFYITNKKWKLNTFTIGSPLALIEAKYEKVEAKYFKDLRFKFKDTKAILFVEVDADKKTTKLGLVF